MSKLLLSSHFQSGWEKRLLFPEKGLHRVWYGPAAFEVTRTPEETVVTTPPVVVTKAKVTLADHLDLKSLPLATTPGGRAFAMKALHPADSEIKVARGPGSMVPTVAICNDSLFTIPWPENCNAAEIVQWANPICPCWVNFYDPTSEDPSLPAEVWFYGNSTFGGGWAKNPAWNSVFGPSASFTERYESYRINAQSLTCQVIAPAVADQGTITSAQYVTRPKTISPSDFARTGSGDDRHVVYTAPSDVWLYDAKPNKASLLLGTSAYSSKAVDGVYQPLKLNKFKFKASADKFYPLTDNGEASIDGGAEGLSTTCRWPLYFPGLEYNYISLFAIPKPTCDTLGVTWIEGTAGHPQVSLRIRFRQVMEAVPVIGTPWAAMAEAPLPPDDLCFRMISEIGGRMKDAYPSSYNDFGKLKDIITTIGHKVVKYVNPALDLLSVVPGVGNVVSGIRTGANIGRAVGELFQPLEARYQKKVKPRRRRNKAKKQQQAALPSQSNQLVVREPGGKKKVITANYKIVNGELVRI